VTRTTELEHENRVLGEEVQRLLAIIATMQQRSNILESTCTARLRQAKGQCTAMAHELAACICKVVPRTWADGKGGLQAKNAGTMGSSVVKAEGVLMQRARSVQAACDNLLECCRASLVMCGTSTNVEVRVPRRDAQQILTFLGEHVRR
jgi:hypothetical protein